MPADDLDGELDKALYHKLRATVMHRSKWHILYGTHSSRNFLLKCSNWMKSALYKRRYNHAARSHSSEVHHYEMLFIKSNLQFESAGQMNAQSKWAQCFFKLVDERLAQFKCDMNTSKQRDACPLLWLKNCLFGMLCQGWTKNRRKMSSHAGSNCGPYAY